jgi:hypothetical protein
MGSGGEHTNFPESHREHDLPQDVYGTQYLNICEHKTYGLYDEPEISVTDHGYSFELNPPPL